MGLPLQTAVFGKHGIKDQLPRKMGGEPVIGKNCIGSGGFRSVLHYKHLHVVAPEEADICVKLLQGSFLHPLLPPLPLKEVVGCRRFVECEPGRPDHQYP
jgi:hypothetical protein